MRKIFTLSLMLVVISTTAQNQTTGTMQTASGMAIAKDPKDTAHKTWKTGALFSLNLSQGSLSNWAAGGDNFSLALTAYVNLHAYYKKGKSSWDNSLDINEAYVNTTSLGSRKNDDRIDLLSKYGYALGPKWDVAALFDFRSQFFKGYTYPTDTSKILSSNIFSPAYVLLGVGLNYHPAKGFSIFMSPATARWIIVTDDSLAAIAAYGVDSGQHVKTEIGAYVSIQYTSNFNKVVSYTGRLDLYSDYLSNPQNIAVYMTNLLAVKLSKVFSLTYSLSLIYDDAIKLFGPNHDAPALQVNSLVGVGLLVRL